MCADQRSHKIKIVPNETKTQNSTTKATNYKLIIIIMSYQDRFQSMGLTPMDQVKQVLKEERNSVVLDVRSLDEIAASGKFEVEGHRWVQTPVMPGATDELVQNSNTLLPDKEAPVVVYCRSGKRAGFAKSALEELGYKHVLNAGGYDDICHLQL